MELNLSPIRVEWSPVNKKEIEDAKKIYIKARRENRSITTIEGIPVNSFSPSLEALLILGKELKDDEFATRIFDESGDRRIIWNSKDIGQRREAAKIFEKCLNDGGRIYSVNSKGEKIHRVFGFDPEKEELLVDEKGTKEKLDKFVKACAEVKVLPKTYPG